jgi:hypothetical protein
MNLTSKQLQILVEEEIKLILEEGDLDEGLWDKIKAAGKAGAAAFKSAGGKKDVPAKKSTTAPAASPEQEKIVKGLKLSKKLLGTLRDEAKNPKEFANMFKHVIDAIQTAGGSVDQKLIDDINSKLIKFNKTWMAQVAGKELLPEGPAEERARIIVDQFNKFKLDVLQQLNQIINAVEKEAGKAAAGKPGEAEAADGTEAAVFAEFKKQVLDLKKNPEATKDELYTIIKNLKGVGNRTKDIFKEKHEEQSNMVVLIKNAILYFGHVLNVKPDSQQRSAGGAPAPDEETAGEQTPEQEKVTKGREIKLKKWVNAPEGLKSKLGNVLRQNSIANGKKIRAAILDQVEKEIKEFLEDPDIFAGSLSVRDKKLQKEARVKPKPQSATHSIDIPGIINKAFSDAGVDLEPKIKSELISIMLPNIKGFLKWAQIPRDKIAALSFPGASSEAPPSAEGEGEGEGEDGTSPGVVTDQEGEDIVASTASRTGYLARKADKRDAMMRNVAQAGKDGITSLKGGDDAATIPDTVSPEDVVQAMALRSKTYRGTAEDQMARMMKGVTDKGSDAISTLKSQDKLDEAFDERNERLYEALMKKLVKNK